MNIDELLLTVQRPARYIGGEWNSVRKEWTDGKTKVLLAFPDVYEVGMSYLGMKILYGILNGRADCLCERVFSPWVDFEDVLRKNKISLFSLESKRPIRDFDIIGFSLAYELSYTNVLNILDLGGIPLLSSQRSDEDPLIIAGGPSCFNPEPVADFIDAFVIGDGEEAVGEIVDVYKRTSGTKYESRKKLLRELADIPGVYVPSLYNVEYNVDGTIKSFRPKEGSVPEQIEKRVVKDLNAAFYPAKQIVPYIQIVHDRIALEVMRGCKHACKFCQATAIYRPWRERSKETVTALAQEAYRMTGYDEISLLSLSSGDHSQIKEMLEALNGVFKDKGVSVSVPSLRVEDILTKLPVLLSEVKKSGLTFAPEAGTDCLRRSLNKDIDINKLLEGAEGAFRAGWKRVKLYFMIGLPTERDEDLAAIADLIYAISDLKRKVDGRNAHIAASVNAFVPKPHTPLQREPMETVEALARKQGVIKGRIRSRFIELSFNGLEMSYVEALFSRGDRRLGPVIFEAWKSGSRFDGWRDHFRYGIWAEALKKCGVEGDFYVTRPRPREEILPWGFVRLHS
ncbi:MAG: TIGR03960 family B12-binding radical SAM protein [Candidatus Omnitrophica bacterium]|nr:TIGR03960 family B12-binding radical SAM protein [Candidatus Omnitrophota bacterium]